jgi:pseudaminic acid synthase
MKKLAMHYQDIKIDKFVIGSQHRPFVVAEMSGNHNHSLERAFEIVEAAAKSGAHALKLQTYTADTMTLNISSGPFLISDPSSLWHGRTLYDLYKEAATPYEWHAPIMERCKALGMTCFSTPFDETAVDFLEDLKVPCYKIASFELTDHPLIKKVASTKKPMIMSTGMASLGEIQEAVTVARNSGAKDIILLKCTSSYPASPLDTNIKTIPNMKDTFQVHVGLSDHTMGIGASIASIAMGAVFIEKHFTLHRSDGGVDSAFSLEPEELKSLVIESERAWQSLGQISYSAGSTESKSKQFRRSLRARHNLKAGHKVTRNDVAVVRPSGGLEPKHLDEILGKSLLSEIKMGDGFSWTDFTR